MTMRQIVDRMLVSFKMAGDIAPATIDIAACNNNSAVLEVLDYTFPAVNDAVMRMAWLHEVADTSIIDGPLFVTVEIKLRKEIWRLPSLRLLAALGRLTYLGIEARDMCTEANRLEMYMCTFKEKELSAHEIEVILKQDNRFNTISVSELGEFLIQLEEEDDKSNCVGGVA